MLQIRSEERGEKKKKKHEPATIHQGTQEKLTHVCSEHPELPVNSEAVMYLSHPFGPHRQPLPTQTHCNIILLLRFW